MKRAPSTLDHRTRAGARVVSRGSPWFSRWYGPDAPGDVAPDRSGIDPQGSSGAVSIAPSALEGAEDEGSSAGAVGTPEIADQGHALEDTPRRRWVQLPLPLEVGR